MFECLLSFVFKERSNHFFKTKLNLFLFFKNSKTVYNIGSDNYHSSLGERIIITRWGWAGPHSSSDLWFNFKLRKFLTKGLNFKQLLKFGSKRCGSRKIFGSWKNLDPKEKFSFEKVRVSKWKKERKFRPKYL